MDQKEKEKIVGELEALQLEETRERVMASRAKREQAAANREHMKQLILRNAAIEIATQADCWHKKGGRGMEGLNRGDDPKFAVAKFQLPHGPVIVICQRCGLIWKKPKALAKSYSTEERKDYMLATRRIQQGAQLPHR